MAPVAQDMGFVPSHVIIFADPAGQVVGTELVVAMVLVLVASVTGGSICILAPAKAGTDAIPKGKTNAANISPLASLDAERNCVADLAMEIPFDLHTFLRSIVINVQCLVKHSGRLHKFIETLYQGVDSRIFQYPSHFKS